jgi:hypothetical protein
MKKIYNSPEMDVIELKQQTLLAGSVTFTVDDTNPIDANTVDAPTFADDDFIDFKD